MRVLNFFEIRLKCVSIERARASTLSTYNRWARFQPTRFFCARHECTSSSVLQVGNAVSFCLCCRPTHSPSVSPAEVQLQFEPHFPSDGLLGQLVTKRFGLENGIVLSHSQVNHCGGQALFAHGWFLEPTPSAPQKWEHCRWWLTQVSDSVSLPFSAFLRTCIAAGEPASSSVSSLL